MGFADVVNEAIEAGGMAMPRLILTEAQAAALTQRDEDQRYLLRESLRLLEAMEWVDHSNGRHDPVCPSCKAIQFDDGQSSP